VLQENYPGFDPERIGIVAFHYFSGQKSAKSALDTGCSDTKDFKDIYAKPGHRLYFVIGYFRLPGERPFSGEREIGSFCAYLTRNDAGYFKVPKFFAYFIPIVTVTPQDVELHGFGIYEWELATVWAKNLQNAFAKLK
jgi:hypothetical protein